MERSLRRDVIEHLLNRSGFVCLSHLCDGIPADRKAILRQMAYLVSEGATIVTKRYPSFRRGTSGPKCQEIIYAISHGKLLALLHRRKRYSAYSGRDKMWRVIRATRRFTRGDLCQLAGVSYGNVHDYVKRLKRAGYIRRRARGVWEIVNDPGPDRPA